MKRQIISCIFVGLALIVLFAGSALLESGWWLVSQALPGGLAVSYYGDKDLKSYVCRRTERQVKKSYKRGRPAMRVSRAAFSARWEGFLLAPQNAEYEFFLQSDDGARLYIDGEAVIDRWNKHSWVPGSHGRKPLQAGRHAIRIEHYNEGGGGGIRLCWCGGSIPSDTIVGTPYITKK